MVRTPHGALTAVVDHESSPSDGEPVQYLPGDGWWLLAVIGSVTFVIVAVGLEVLGGSFANSPSPDWAHLVPIAWPTGLRVLWWVAVAAAAGLFRFGLHRLGMRQRPVIVAASVLPFLAFAVGIAAGSSWSTWH